MMSKRQQKRSQAASLKALVAQQQREMDALRQQLASVAAPAVLPKPTPEESFQASKDMAERQAGAPAGVKKKRLWFVMPDQTAETSPGLDKVLVPGTGTRKVTNEVALAKVEKLAPGSTVDRLAFESDPNDNTASQGVYVPLKRLVPDDVKKRVAIMEDLVACIVGGRAFQMSHFGKPRPDRFSFGFVIQPTPARLAHMSPQEREELRPKIDRAVKRLYHCGDEEAWDNSDRMTLSEWLFQTTRNAVIVGRLACEVIEKTDPITGEPRFAGFRPVDAGTIYRAAPQGQTQAASVREQSRALLENIADHKLDSDRFDVRRSPGRFWERWEDNEFRWVQVIEGRPLQVFTDTELRVKNLYPVLDWETNGYPITPIDNAMTAISTRLNITTYNKNYFLHGRAARGMIVIQSEDVDDALIRDLKQHMQAAVTGASNAWRMPVFGVGQNDKVTWVPFDQGTKDMEFQYLSDNNARTILSVFQMSPEELPGYAHLSRGSNNQSLAESNNEWKLQAHRDLGMRPLLSFLQDFINTELLPLVAPDLVGICEVQMLGLDAETAEKEAVRIQQDLVHSTYNELLHRTEKRPIGQDLAGDVPLNQQWQATADKYVLVGSLRERLLRVKGAEEDMRWNYPRDPFWFQQQQWIQGLLGAVPQMFGPPGCQVLAPSLIRALFPYISDQQAQQLAQAMAQQAQAQLMQAQAAAQGGQAAAQGGQAAGDGQDGEQGGGSAEGGAPEQGAQDQQGEQQEDDLTRSIDQALAALGKGEKALPPAKRRILRQHQLFVKKAVGSLTKELDDLFGKHGV